MVSQITAYLALAAPIFVLALKAGIMLGVIGSFIEALGAFLGRFSSTKVQAVGAFLGRAGRMLEAWGTDVPKVVTNATEIASRLGKFVNPAVLVLVVGSVVLASSLGACGAAQAKAEAENAAIVAGCKVSESLVDAGDAGAANEAADLVAIKAGCTSSLRVWDRSK